MKTGCRSNKMIAAVAALAVAAAMTGLAIAQSTESLTEPGVGGLGIPWRDEAFGCRLSARAVREDYSFAEPILVEVVLENVTENTQRVSWDPSMWLVRATDQLGGDVPPTRYARYLVGGVPGHPRTGGSGTVVVLPGYPHRQVIELNRLCDLTMGGTYSVEIGRVTASGKNLHDAVVLKAPPLTVRIDGGQRSLSASVQKLALSKEPDRREAALESIGKTLKHGIEVVQDSARNDASPQVRKTATRVLKELNAFMAESATSYTAKPIEG